MLLPRLLPLSPGTLALGALSCGPELAIISTSLIDSMLRFHIPDVFSYGFGGDGLLICRLLPRWRSGDYGVWQKK